MNRRTFIGAFAWVWALTRSGLERLAQAYKGAAESNQNSQRGKTWAAFEIDDLNAKREGASCLLWGRARGGLQQKPLFRVFDVCKSACVYPSIASHHFAELS